MSLAVFKSTLQCIFWKRKDSNVNDSAEGNVACDKEISFVIAVLSELILR